MATQTLSSAPSYRASWRDAFGWLSRRSSWLVVATYASLVSVGIVHHEPWADEAQAWQLARYLSVGRLFVAELRYEGSPGLWHLFLHLLGRLHVSYVGMHWVAGVIATCGAALLVTKAPFPKIIRCLLPFTFVLAFQFAVVARSYVLAPLLLFALATSWRRHSALLPAVLLGLLANVSLHCFAIAVGFGLVYLIEVFRKERRVGSPLAAGVALAIFFSIAVLTVLPQPADIMFSGAPRQQGPFINGLVWLIKCSVYLVYGLAKPLYIGCILFVSLVWAFWRAPQARYLLPLITLAMFSGYFFNFWHLGLLLPTAISAAWMIWPISLRSSSADVVATAAFWGFLFVQAVWMAYAYAYDYRFAYSPDRAAAAYLTPYITAHSPMAVTFIKNFEDQPPKPDAPDPISAFHWVGLGPYFSGPLFINEPLPFWRWSKIDHKDETFLAAMQQQPKIVMAIYYDNHYKPFDPARDLARPRVKYLLGRGYVLSKVFCGSKPEDLKEREHICDLIFER